jgi:hypothetical protein
VQRYLPLGNQGGDPNFGIRPTNTLVEACLPGTGCQERRHESVEDPSQERHAR